MSIQIGQRLIQQRIRRLAHQRARQRHPLALAAGKLARPALQQMADTEKPRGPLDLLRNE